MLHPPPPDPRFVPHPDLADAADGYTTLWLDLNLVLDSWRQSLWAFEWLRPDGTLKSLDDLTPDRAHARTEWEKKIKTGQPLPQPILGVGEFQCVEIGAERALVAALASLGYARFAAHIPTAMTGFFKKLTAKPSTQRGNLFVFIFLSVVLISALTLAVMNTSRFSNTNMLSANQAKALAAEQISYATQVQAAVARLTLRGCSDAQLNFDNATVGGYTNAGAPADGSCDVFSTTGGNVTWATPASSVTSSPWFITGTAVVHNAGGASSTLTNANADLTLMLLDIPSEACAAINTALKISAIPVDDGAFTSNTKFTGTYAASENINGINAAAQPSPCIGNPATPHLCGVKAGCFREGGGGQRYIFYQVLLAR